jgi:hypothetical protein
MRVSRDKTEFPQSSHLVFENYIAKRFSNDRDRLAARFALTAQAARTVAEQAAYCMSAEPGLGLSPQRNALLDAMARAGFPAGEETRTALSALEYLRLARPVEEADGQTGGFTFAHRRFQEYFATCLIMRESTRADPLSLLTDGRWRETAVTLLQTQSDTAIQPLLQQAGKLLRHMTAVLPPAAEPSAADAGPAVPFEAAAVFGWPPGSLHLLGLLQDGLPSGDHRRPPEIGDLAGRLLTAAYASHQLHDRRWAVQACLAAEPEIAWGLIRDAFDSDSGWLREAAFAQAGRLTPTPHDVRQQVRAALAQLAAGGRLRQQRLEVDAQLRRLPDPQGELLLAALFRRVPFVDSILWAALTVSVAITLGFSGATLAELATAAVAHISVYLVS